MKQQEIRRFLKHFFAVNGCEIVEETDQSVTVQLTEEMDRAIMNRPFYWQYIESTGGTGAPARLTFITDFSADKKIKGERIAFGSPRISQLFSYAMKRGRYIRLYENRTGSAVRPVRLVPWLSLNMKISYECDRKKDRLRSVGLHLINGSICEPFHELITSVDLVPKIPDFSYTLSPLILPGSGIMRIKHFIEEGLREEDKQWAAEARKRWEEDQRLLDHFYKEEREKPEKYFMEKEALKEQYEPRINVTVINGGIFYLTDETVLGQAAK